MVGARVLYWRIKMPRDLVIGSELRFCSKCKGVVTHYEHIVFWWWIRRAFECGKCFIKSIVVGHDDYGEEIVETLKE
jgi:hypothetical protein